VGCGRGTQIIRRHLKYGPVYASSSTDVRYLREAAAAALSARFSERVMGRSVDFAPFSKNISHVTRTIVRVSFLFVYLYKVRAERTHTYRTRHATRETHVTQTIMTKQNKTRFAHHRNKRAVVDGLRFYTSTGCPEMYARFESNYNFKKKLKIIISLSNHKVHSVGLRMEMARRTQMASTALLAHAYSFVEISHDCFA